MAAGDFSTWVVEVQAAIRGQRASVVPCGGCTACCTSGQFVHIGPEERETLAHIPEALLFPAPRRPGHVLLGYDDRGHCPMLVNEQCSIYRHRPQACRTYDCRVFPAAGVAVDDDDENKALIGRRARQWQFQFPTAGDRTEHQAVRAAATFLADQPELGVDGTRPANATELAVLAIEVHHAFLRRDETTGETVVVEPDPETVLTEVRRVTGVRGPSSSKTGV